MQKAGDKYIIEIESVFMPAITTPKIESVTQKIDIEIPRKPLTLYRIKGFNSLVFDDQGLSKLEKYEPKEENTRFDKVELQIGDEVCDRNDMIWVITRIEECDNHKDVSGIDSEGITRFGFSDDIVATGRHFDTIADTLKSLKHEE